MDCIEVTLLNNTMGAIPRIAPEILDNAITRSLGNIPTQKLMKSIVNLSSCGAHLLHMQQNMIGTFITGDLLESSFRSDQHDLCEHTYEETFAYILKVCRATLTGKDQPHLLLVCPAITIMFLGTMMANEVWPT
ncbi:hypothetical protein GQR58_028616 [Nymphon striatum]|nr:hypothetical protein GQR58_028616 [Nymphon striatum]